MKARTVIISLMVTITIFLAASSITQAHPPWARQYYPNIGVGFVFFPEYNFYYDFHRGGYFYLVDGNWMFGIELPMMYSHVNFGLAMREFYSRHYTYPWQYNRDHFIRFNKKHHTHFLVNHKVHHKSHGHYSKNKSKSHKSYYKSHNKGHGRGGGKNHKR